MDANKTTKVASQYTQCNIAQMRPNKSAAALAGTPFQLQSKEFFNSLPDEPSWAAAHTENQGRQLKIAR